MTIFEMILNGLQTKFTGVDVSILTRIANKYAEGVTDAEQVNSVVEGISFVEILNSYGDFRAGQAQKSAVGNYEKKYGIKDGKPIEKAKEVEQKEDEAQSEMPPWAKAILEANNALAAKLQQAEELKAKTERQKEIVEVAKKYGINEATAKRFNLDKEDDLDEYFKNYKQEIANKGTELITPPETAEQKVEKNSSEIASMINQGTEDLIKNLNK